MTDKTQTETVDTGWVNPVTAQIVNLMNARTPIISIKAPAAEHQRIHDMLHTIAFSKSVYMLDFSYTKGFKFVPMHDDEGSVVVSVDRYGFVQEGGHDKSPFDYGLAIDMIASHVDGCTDTDCSPNCDKRHVRWDEFHQAVAANAGVAVQGAIEFSRKAIFVFLNINDLLRMPNMQQRLYDAYRDFLPKKKHIFLISTEHPTFGILESIITRIEWPLASYEELLTEVALMENTIRERHSAIPVQLSENGHEKMTRALQGMTLAEARATMQRMVVEHKEFSDRPELLETIVNQKADFINEHPALTFFEPDERRTLSDIGGGENVKSYIIEASHTFSDDAEEYGAQIPRGVLLIGPPGTGKSEISKNTATEMSLPLVQLDMPRIYGASGGLVGQSEQALITALERVKAVAPCILQLDEVEKGANSGAGETDGGTSERVLAFLLSWLEDVGKGQVFVIATANRGTIDPALLRRLSRRYVVDLPGPMVREEILAIHLRKRGRDAENYDLTELADITVGFSGGELEELVQSAVNASYVQRKQGLCEDVEQGHLVQAAQQVVPVARTMGPEIDNMREWLKDGRALPAHAEFSDFAVTPRILPGNATASDGPLPGLGGDVSDVDEDWA